MEEEVFVMKIIYERDFDENSISSELIFRRIDLLRSKEMKLFRGMGGKYDSELCEVLNSINNQGIEMIDTIRMYYKKDGEILSFDRLCKAERVFLIAFAAYKQNKTIWLMSDMTQLTDTTLKLFFKLFRDSNVNIIVQFDSDENYCRFEYLEKGA